VQRALKNNVEKSQELENQTFSLEKKIFRLEHDLRLAATIDELQRLQAQVNKLPTMNEINTVTAKFEEFVRGEDFVRSEEVLKASLKELSLLINTKGNISDIEKNNQVITKNFEQLRIQRSLKTDC
jgi:hypothetical protein